MNKRQTLTAFFQDLKNHMGALLLDYDGTLAPFHEDRTKAIPYPGILERLEKIVECPKTFLAIISGRALVDLLPLLPMQKLPQIWSSHGMEQLQNGQLHTTELTQAEKKGLQLAAESLQGKIPQEYLEYKPASLALHWRGLDSTTKKSIEQTTLMEWEKIATSYSLKLTPFNGGIELRSIRKTKADAVKAIQTQLPKDTLVVYIGDDLTDEDAFQALGNQGLKILISSENRPTLADLKMEPSELIAFLDCWIDAQQGRGKV